MKHQKPDTSRPNAEKREKGSEAEGTPAKKKRNNKKDLELGGAEADDEEPRDNRRKTIQKPVGPSTIGIQRLREEFVNANNKGMITKEQYEQFDSL